MVANHERLAAVLLGALLVLELAGCGSSDGGERWSRPLPLALSYSDGTSFHQRASDGRGTRGVSSALDELSTGTDSALMFSGNGEWLVVLSSRFGCAGWDCLARVDGELSEGQAIEVPAAPPFDDGRVHATGSAAISSDGNVVVFQSSGGTHATDLFVTRLEGGAWTAPVELTSASSSAYHLSPVLSASATKVVFNCGEDPYAQTQNGICEVGTDASGLRTVYLPATGTARFPAYAPDGTVVFEGEFEGGELIYRVNASGGGVPVRLTHAGASDDNSPCVFADGRIASLWLPDGLHEAKVMDASGASYEMVVTGIDIADVGIGCSGPP